MHVRSPDYTATVETSFTEGIAASNGHPVSVNLTGQATYLANGEPATDKPVSLRIRVQGSRRVIPIPQNTNAQGQFSFTFSPLPNEAGLYKVFANHPAIQEDLNAPQDTFVLKALRFQPNSIVRNVRVGDAPIVVSAPIRNLGDVQVDGISASIENAPDFLDLAANAPPQLGPNATGALGITLSASALPASPSTPAEITVRLYGMVNGVSTMLDSLLLKVFVQAQEPYLVVSPATVSATVALNRQEVVTFNVTNTGGAVAQNVVVKVPCLANPDCSPPPTVDNCSPGFDQCPNGLWLSLATPVNIGDLAPGESRQVQIALNPIPGVPLGLNSGNIGVSSENSNSTQVQFGFTVQSDQMGSLRVQVQDEATCYPPSGGGPGIGSPSGPLVANANVSLINQVNGQTVASGVTDSSGEISFGGIPEGTYTLRTTAPDHDSFTGVVQIRPNEQTVTTTFISSNVVTYSWVVEPTNIPDQYNINIVAVFQTYVPIPIVTIEPTVVDLDLAPGQEIHVEYQIKNHGPIAAQGAELILNSPSGYDVTALVSDLGDIPGVEAGQSPVPIIVPVTIRRLSGGEGFAGGEIDCNAQTVSGLRWFLICNEPIYHWVSTFYRYPLEDCPGSPPSGGCPPQGCGGGPGASNTGGGASYNPPPLYVQPTMCQPPPNQVDECPPCRTTCKCNLAGGPNGNQPGSGDEGKDASDFESGGQTNPIRYATGEAQESFVDLQIPGRGMDFVWGRHYRSKIGPVTAQGNNWDFTYNLWIERSGQNVIFHNGGGRKDVFAIQPDGTWARDEFFQDFARNADGSYTFTQPDRTEMNFFALVEGDPKSGKISTIVDRNGNTIAFSYDAQNGRMIEVIDTLGRSIAIAYNADGLIESVTDFAGRQLRFDYYQDGDANGSDGDLKSITTPVVFGTPNDNDFPDGKTTVFTYSTGLGDDRLNHNLLTITDAKGQTYLRNIYYATTDPSDRNFDRVSRQVWGDVGDNVDLVYVPMVPTAENSQAILRTIVNDRVGNVSEYDYDILNRLVRKREFTGRADPDQPTTTGGNRPAGKLRPEDPSFYETTFGYNADSRLVHHTAGRKHFTLRL
ncbi:MAG: carboxypeptidase regulatory-like domain-containing protein [Planctomycetes bacterium]|nr:carboxypeptidase regulatory-like domain-containing protein [Planctomycetota bacterium]